MKVKITLDGVCTQKLAFVKLLKECTGLGLRESKDIADIIFTPAPLKEFEIFPDKYKTLENGLKEIDGNFTLSGGTQWKRESSMLSLGIGDNKDYFNFISEFINETKNTEILEYMISKLTKKDLQDTIDKINKYYKT